MVSAHEILSNLAQEKLFSEFLQRCSSQCSRLVTGCSDPLEQDAKNSLLIINLGYVEKIVNFLRARSPDVLKQIDAIELHLDEVACRGLEFSRYIKSLSEVREEYLKKREEQILALASGLHPRLGVGSSLLTAYNNPLGNTGLINNLKTVIKLVGP